ncbi:MAG: hypothetical protein WBE18_06640 [Gammaproteobacteria bacterium]
MSLGTNKFFYLDVKALVQQGCDKEMLHRLQQVTGIMNGRNMKPLVGEYYLDISINGAASLKNLPITHELRIANSQARVLVVTLASDQDKKYLLYIGCKFLPRGLHELRDEKALQQSNKSKNQILNKNVAKITLVAVEDKTMVSQNLSRCNNV